MVDERTLAFARELAAADDDVAATLAELDALAREVEALRAGAVAASTRIQQLPQELAEAAAARSEAERLVAQRREDVRTAEEARAAGAGDEVARSEHALTRARDALRMAERRLEAAAASLTQLEEEDGTLAADAGVMVARASDVAQALAERAALAAAAGVPPGDDLAAVGRWATDARAALFVARGQLASQREQLIRQANELAAAVLGEPVAASSAAAVARRVEAAAD